MTPTDAIRYAARKTQTLEAWAEELLAALPEGTHLFTVDTLAEALDKTGLGATLQDITRHPDSTGYAAAIIQAAKEAERE